MIMQIPVNIQEFLSNPSVMYTKTFLFKCGYYSFFYGLFTNTVEVIFSNPHKTAKKYFLPNILKPATQLIIWFESFVKILYGGISNGLIGLTWPISIPLIKYSYKFNQEDTNQGK